MSRIGYIGRSCRILYRGEILAAVRTKAVNHIRAAIDCSDEERDGWRHLDPKYESVGVEISVEGVTTEDNYALLEQWLGDTFTELAIGFPDGTIEIAEDGAFLRNLTYSGEHAGFVSFAAAFVFSGEVHVLQELVLTSRPYPLEVLDALESIGDAIRAMPSFRYPLDIAESFGDIVSGTLEAPLITYDGYEPEAIDSAGDLVSGEIALPLIPYDGYEPEAIASAGDLMSGEIADVLIRYDGYEPEAIDSAGDIISGALS